MSIGIVSSKEGRDESHINDTKIGTKFWNDVNKVTTIPTQKTNTETVLTIEVKLLQLPFEHQAERQETQQHD